MRLAARTVDLRKVYGTGEAAVEALRGSGGLRGGRVQHDHGRLRFGQADAALPGGAGRPTSGRVLIGDVDLTELSEKQLSDGRRSGSSSRPTTVMELSVPVGRLVGYAIPGVVAAAVPARRAARLNVLEAIAYE